MIYIMYAQTAFLCCIVLCFILYQVHKTPEYSPTQKAFRQLVTFSILFCIVDMLWGIFASNTLNWGRQGFAAISYSFHAMSACAAFLWTRFTLTILQQFQSIKVLRFISKMLFATQILILFSNFWNDSFFAIKEDLLYVTGGLRTIVFFIQITNYFMMGLIALYLCRNAEGRKDYRVRNVLIYASVAGIAGILQLLVPDMPMSSCGFMLSCLSVSALTITVEHETAINKNLTDLTEEWQAYSKALMMRAEYSYFADLTDNVIRKAPIYKNPQATLGRVQADYPMEYDTYLDVWHRSHFITPVDYNFELQNTYRDRLIELYHEGETLMEYEYAMGDGSIFRKKTILLDKNIEGHIIATVIVSSVDDLHGAELRAKITENESRDFSNAIACLYISLYRYSLVDRMGYKLKVEEQYEDVSPDKISMEDMIAMLQRDDLDKKSERNLVFCDVTTLSERLKDNNAVSIEVHSKHMGWVAHIMTAYKWDEEGNLTDVLWITRRISEEKKRELGMNAAREEALQEAQRANAAKTHFLSSMSHDIRTPMNAIIGMADIAMRHAKEPERVEDSLNKIVASGRQLVSLVNDILDISAIENGKLTIHPVEYNLPAGFDHFQSLFSNQLEVKGQTGLFSIHDIVSPWVLADDVRIHQIFTNVLGNAIKYTPDGGTVSLEVYQEYDEDGVLNTIGIVKDTGIGMSEEFMERMWDTFSRATDTRINTVQGSGLGLSIVRELLGLMQGTIEVASELNAGSTFKVVLPLPPIEHQETEDDGTNKSEQLSLKVLLAEDNEMNWEIAQELLALHGINAVRAENGEQCLHMFTETPTGTYDLILMDMQMPIMDGVCATKEIRGSAHAEAQTIPIIAMTANAFAEDVARCMEAGMNEHLSKPLDMDKVLTTIRRYVQK